MKLSLRPIGLSTVALAGLLAAGCDSATAPEAPVEAPTSAELDQALLEVGKADSGAAAAPITVYRQGLGLRGAPAQVLYGLMDEAGAYETTGYGKRLLVGPATGCITNGLDTYCEIRSHQTHEGRAGDDFAARVRGKRFASAASYLFGLVAGHLGVDPASVNEVDTPWLRCEKDHRNVQCAIDRPEALSLAFENLEPAGDGYVYEGWAVGEVGPTSTGRFADPAAAYVQHLPARLAAAAPTYVLTLEPQRGDSPEPAATHVLAGALQVGGTAALGTEHPAALGTNFADAAGAFILATPSSATTDDETQGIWFVDPAAGAPSLDLPELPEGWVYEGWVVGADGPISTGRFTALDRPDADGAGPAAGPEMAPPFPGQDFVDPALDLVGRAVVISVEPEPDDSPAPFATKPLVGVAGAAVAPELQDLTLTYANRPHGFASLGGADASARSGEIWTADRASGFVTTVDVLTSRALAHIPTGGEPMYVNHSDVAGLTFVGDRENSVVLAIDPATRAIVDRVPVPAGVFHQWIAPGGHQLWVNSDVDNVTTVIDVRDRSILASIPMPADLAAMGGKPHDVLVSPDLSAAFVTYLGFGGDHDYVVRFDATTFEETARYAVGLDPHVSASARNDLLFVACQNTDEVIILHRDDLTYEARMEIPGAHGVGMTNRGDYLYVTNLPAGGDDALFVLDVHTQRLVNDMGVDVAMVGVPHNLALDGRDERLYVTHSGPTSALLSVLTVSADRPEPVLEGVVQVGGNPFGLGFVPR